MNFFFNFNEIPQTSWRVYFLLCLKFGEKIKIYSDLKMENSISLFIDIATDQCAPQLHVLLITCCFLKMEIKRKRRRSDPVLWQNPLYQQKIRKPKDNTHKSYQKLRLRQRLRTDLGRSVGVTSNPTGVVKPVYGIPTFPLTAKAV